MAEVVVVISDALLFRACNMPGGSGGVADWADDQVEKIKRQAIARSPVGDPLDAGSRGWMTGEFVGSWFTERGRGNQHQVVRWVGNRADHAKYLEFDREPAHGRQVFTWWQKGGKWQKWMYTGWRPGRHILEDATRRVMGI